jgi:hypothetical protein
VSIQLQLKINNKKIIEYFTQRSLENHGMAALVNTGMSLQFPYNARNFLTG